MNDIRKERLVISIVTLASISCIIQNFFGAWEFWVPGVVDIGVLGMWWIHLAQRMDQNARITVYFVFSAFLLFYHGVHDTSLFDISVSAVLFIAVFAIADRIVLLNLVLIEYLILMAIQFYYLIQSDGDDLDAFSTMRVVYHIGTVIVMYVFSRIAISRRAREHDRIEKWKASVAENDRDMEDFLSNVSHELRTPVNVISGMTALMKKKSDADELTSIQDAGLRLAYQIEDIQDYTEIKRGELALENENYMCISLINDIVANYNAAYRDSDLELVIDLSPETPTMLNGDVRKLHKIFRHLLDNAIKFTHKGGVLIRIFTEIRDYGVNLMIEIKDTGVGMTRADMARVSKGMYQANKKRNRSTGGIGIGLPIVYGFVHKMDGFVMIHSQKNSGTTVRITIPQTVVDPLPCLTIKEEVKNGIVFYIRPDKYQVPEVRDFYRTMAVNLATGLKTKLYSAAEVRELEHLIKDYEITHVFTGMEEYDADRDYLDGLSKQGIRVVVSSESGFKVTPDSGVLVMPKPLYAFPVVRILNGEEGITGFANSEEKKVRFTGVSALIVDDEPMNLVVASGLLREYRMFADTAESGKEAIRKYKEGDYDVIFMDHMMPEMDGVETMKHIRDIASETDKNPIIIALTANALSGAREMFMQEGFDGFIAKPIDMGLFEKVMKNLLPDDMIHYEGRDDR